MKDPSSEYEITINKLSEQINELFSKIHYYQALIAEKDLRIKHLSNENQRLLVKIQKLSQIETPPPTPPPSQQSYTPPTLLNNPLLHRHPYNNLSHHHQSPHNLNLHFL